jgi:hypothetical protein
MYRGSEDRVGPVRVPVRRQCQAVPRPKPQCRVALSRLEPLARAAALFWGMDQPLPTERLRRSVEQVGQRMVFDDGRRPAYFGLLDLPSKPFWTAQECDAGVTALLRDLQAHHAELLAEARRVEAQELARNQGTLQSNGLWFVHTVAVEGKMTDTCPVLLQLLERHRSVACSSQLFSAVIISILRQGGVIHP